MIKTKIALLLAAMLAGGSVSAAQFGAQIEPTTETLRQKVAETVQEQAQPQVQEQAQAQVQEQVKSASTLAYDFLNSAVEQGALSEGEGWNEEQQTLVVIQTATFDAKSLVNPDDFLKMRPIKAVEASLSAKAEIIRYIRTEMSVENLLTMPDTGLSTEFDKELHNLQRLIEAKTQAYQQALADVDSAKAMQIGKVNAEDLVVEGIAACLKRMGVYIDLSKLEKAQAERLQKAQEELLALQTQLDDLKEKAEKLRGSLQQENVSTVETMSAMPLVGAMTIAQFESSNNGKYEVSVVMTWSGKQERAVRAMLAGEKLELNPGAQKLSDYIRTNDWSTALGGRKFLDDKGNYIILGIGAWPITNSSSAARRAAEGFARTQAQSNIALMLKGDVAAYEMAAQKVQEIRGGKTGAEIQTQTTDSMAQTLSEKVSNLNIQGMSRRFGKVVSDPFTGSDMFVAVYSMSVTDGIAAKKIEKTNFAAAEAITKMNQHSQGVKAGLNASIDAVQKSKTDFNKGFAEGKASSDAINQPKPEAVGTNPVNQQSGEPKKSTSPNNTSFKGAGSSAAGFGF